MELKNFREKGKTNYVFVWIGFSLVILLTIIIFIRSYALYEEKKTYDVIQGNVPHFLDSYDVQVAFTLDGVASSSKPQGEDLVVDQIVCTNGALGFWDSEKERFYLESLTKSKTKCRIDFVTRYEEAILVGNDPKLSSILVPIQIMEDGVVKKASLGDEWYRYENKNWANAVILKDKQVVYSSGETIPEENIESYFVWIPKYEYQIFNDGNYQSVGTVKEDHSQEIQVRFQKQDEVTNGSQSVGEWFSHPAFKNSGFWVGKFETGYRDATNSNEAVQDEIIPKQIVIKPNVYSWRGVRVSTAFQNAYQYQREYDSHMMKNTEWGAVAYLSHSKYGIMNSIRYNNHSDYKTGYAAVLEPTCDINDETCNQTGNTENVTKPYNTNIGYLASTTGNISGIYDMSGGA
ncbi:MAG: hypothetical protein HFH86_01625, partial [Bacilli bacterium]|nr:hypothetical protein [Bacilli bacterium]